jgi:uncharacterized membrane protein
MLDILRGIAVLGMVFHHGMVSAEIVFDTVFEIFYTPLFHGVQLVFVAVFLLVSGICTNYSRSIVKRGLIVTGAAAVVSVATCVVMPMMGMYGLEIYFGILHMFGLSMLLYGLFRKFFEKIPVKVGIALFTGMFIAYYPIYLAQFRSPYYILMIFGILPESITSYGDYYPLLPYFFLFLAGTYIGKYVKEGRFPKLFYTARCKVLEFFGRHTLWIYVLHQPIIFGLLMTIKIIANIS